MLQWGLVRSNFSFAANRVEEPLDENAPREKYRALRPKCCWGGIAAAVFVVMELVGLALEEVRVSNGLFNVRIIIIFFFPPQKLRKTELEREGGLARSLEQGGV